MSVLVTGANGFLGRALIARLLARGETQVRCFVREGSDLSGLEQIFAQYQSAEADFSFGDMTNAESVAAAVDGVETVYHLAAAMKGTAADMVMNTVVGTKNLLNALKKDTSIRLVLVSSFGVYGVQDLPAGYIVNETTPVENNPERRDIYSFSKHRQEKLCWEYHEKYRIPLVVLRPGVIYGPGGVPMSSRVGVSVFGVFLHLGRNNPLPLSYVDNCAEAICVAGQAKGVEGQIFNVHDDDLPTSKQYLKAYRKHVKRMKFVTVPYFAIKGLSSMVEKYNKHSKGQLPAIFTPYKTDSMWKGNRFDNSKIKAIGWKQLVPTEEGMRRTFDYFGANGKS